MQPTLGAGKRVPVSKMAGIFLSLRIADKMVGIFWEEEAEEEEEIEEEEIEEAEEAE